MLGRLQVLAVLGALALFCPASGDASDCAERVVVSELEATDESNVCLETSGSLTFVVPCDSGAAFENEVFRSAP